MPNGCFNVNLHVFRRREIARLVLKIISTSLSLSLSPCNYTVYIYKIILSYFRCVCRNSFFSYELNVQILKFIQILKFNEIYKTYSSLLTLYRSTVIPFIIRIHFYPHIVQFILVM